MTGDEWIAAFAERVGAEPPDEVTMQQLLDLAGTAAHQSERIAAPIACYLVGRAGLDVTAAQRLAGDIAP